MAVIRSEQLLPVEVVFAPDWWHARFGINFDRGFFFDPARRVAEESRMRGALYETFGDLGLGEKDDVSRPIVGAVHLAAGYFIASLLGCAVVFHDNAPPDVIPANIGDKALENWTPPALEDSPEMRELLILVEVLRNEYGAVEGDINWSGVQNAALDLRGQSLLMDYYDKPETVARVLDGIAGLLVDFVSFMDEVTGTSSISVNRSILKIDQRLHLHSNCSVTMISADVYRQFLLPIEKRLASRFQPYAIHHCGTDMDRFATSYAEIGDVALFDVGWGSDVSACRKALPDAYLNLRLSPSRLASCTPEEIAVDVKNLALAAGPLDKTGFCCVNLDATVPDENVRAFFHAVDEIRYKQCS